MGMFKHLSQTWCYLSVPHFTFPTSNQLTSTFFLPFKFTFSLSLSQLVKALFICHVDVELVPTEVSLLIFPTFICKKSCKKDFKQISLPSVLSGMLPGYFFFSLSLTYLQFFKNR